MMTVRCPNCAATYQLDASKLANGGRKLKCAQCQTVWIATAEPPAEMPQPAVEAAPEVAVTEAAPQPEPAADVPEQAPVEEPEAGLPVDEDLIQRTPGLEAVVQVGGWRQYVRGGNIWRSGALAMIVVGIVAGGAVAWLKYGANHTAPDTIESHGEAHEEAKPRVSEVVQPPEGVVLHNVRGEVDEIDGGQGGVSLTVRGLLTNTTSATVVVPPLRLELLGADGKVADMWPVSNVSGTMLPAAEQAWTVSLAAPDMTSLKGWRVVFVRE